MLYASSSSRTRKQRLITKTTIWIVFFVVASVLQQRIFWPGANNNSEAYFSHTGVSMVRETSVSANDTIILSPWEEILAADPVVDCTKEWRTIPSIEESLKDIWRKLAQDTHRNGISQKFLANVYPRRQNISTTESIVLTTHCGVSKLDRFITQLEYWRGPASVGVYINEAESQIGDLLKFAKKYEDQLGGTSIHVLIEYSEDKSKWGYPHNPLRNLAMDYSGSDYFVAADVDLIPGPWECHAKLLASMKMNGGEMMRLMAEKRQVFVLPAFDLFPEDGNKVAMPNQLPKDKESLIELVQSGKGEPFRYSRWKKGHHATNFPRWYESKDISFYNIEYEESFEPYVLAYRPGIPRYWKAFRGYGHNKISWFMELHRAGYQFATTLDAYFIHLAHPSTKNVEESQKNVDSRNSFIDYLDARYPLQSGMIRFNKILPPSNLKLALKKCTKIFRKFFGPMTK